MTNGALLVDLDGTLVDTAPDMVAALERLCRRNGRTAPDRDLARAVVSSGSMALLRLGFGDEEASARRDELLPAFLADYTANVAQSSALFAGWDRVLEYVESRGVRWGVVTNKPEHISRKLLAELELAERCGCIIGGDTLSVRKPHPEPLLAAADSLNANPSSSLYVGDHQRDIDAGQAAGMRTIAAAWGYIVDGDGADRWGADHVIDSPADLLALLVERSVA
ncbi:MAG: HAD-IA family hydrolase [Pseudomonadota bacterium]